jgi:NTE family protein
VRDASLRIFTNEDLTLDALLASACIPAMHHTVEVEGEAYWDGGLTANPPLSSLVYRSDARELLIVLLNPDASDDVPSTADAILERFTQISFSSTLSAELQAIGLAKAEAERGRRFCVGRVDRRLRALNIQVIESPGYMSALDPASRYRTDSTFTEALRDEGRKAAEVWLSRVRGARPLQQGDTSTRGVMDASRKSECSTG